MDICDEDFCWLCSMPDSCCNCEFSDFIWSRPASQESSCTFDGHKKPANFDTDELAFGTIYGGRFVGGALENLDDMIQWPGRESQQPCAASTPKYNNDPENWESPGTVPPPDSSSPSGLGTDSSPFSTGPVLPMSPREDVIMDRLLFCHPHDNGLSHVKALLNDRIPATISLNRSFSPSHTSALTFRTQGVPFVQSYMGASLSVQGHPGNTSEGNSSHPSRSSAQISPDVRRERQGDIPVSVQDICAMTIGTAIKQTNNLAKLDGIDLVPAPGSLISAASIVSGPTIRDLSASTELEPASSHSTENDRPKNDKSHDTTTADSDGETNGHDRVPSEMFSRRVSIISVLCPARATPPNRMKRRRSSVDWAPGSKKVKLDGIASQVSCVSDSSVETKYRATEPASIRRARSLRSEVSTYSEESTDSQDSFFYPSPLSSPTTRPPLDKDYPPTVPSTPLPNSVDYARSKANPLIRTAAVYRRRSLSIPVIPPVPIIAPPPSIQSTLVRCSEDQAIDRLQALLLRQRSERERDGLHVHDEKRAKRLKPTDSAFSRRDSASTSDSSNARDEWEEESTRSAIDTQESQNLAPSVKILPEPHRHVNRETWSNAFGITNDFRKEITEWILKQLPKEPAPREKTSRHERHLGIDLYDQLTNSRQTRFHAAQLFHRYFLLPEKVQFWREGCKHERLDSESCGLYDNSCWEGGVWDLAVACVALSVKLHRDCLPPLCPVYAAEFLDMAPFSMTHEAFELAQRDIMDTFHFLLGSCTPQDVLDELWNALPTLRKATFPIRDGWAVVQRVTWDKLFESLFEPDMLQYPVTLLTAAALIDGLIFALTRQYRTEGEANVCQCTAPPKTAVSECVPDDIDPTSWQIHLFEANQLVDDVILDVKDVLRLSDMELDECRTWLSYVGEIA